MPESGDAFARLLRDADGPAAPRPEFADALLARLLGELTGNPEDVASSPPPAPTLPSTPAAVERRQENGRESAPARRLPRFPTALATAALVLLTAVASFLVLAPGRLLRQAQAPALMPAISGTAATETVVTDTLLDATTDELPTGHALIEVHRWRLQPSFTPLILWPQDGVVMIVVDSGAITATVAGTEHGLAAGDTLGPNTQEIALRAAESKEATAYVVYIISGWAKPGLLERGQATGDSLAHAEDRLITASTDTLPGGSARFSLERQTLSPGSALSPQQVSPFAWFGIGEGALALTLEGERLPLRWKSGAERTFRHGQFLPFLAAGTTMTLRNAGDDPLVLYRLTLGPLDARGSATGTPGP